MCDACASEFGPSLFYPYRVTQDARVHHPQFLILLDRNGNLSGAEGKTKTATFEVTKRLQSFSIHHRCYLPSKPIAPALLLTFLEICFFLSPCYVIH